MNTAKELIIQANSDRIATFRNIIAENDIDPDLPLFTSSQLETYTGLPRDRFNYYRPSSLNLMGSPGLSGERNIIFYTAREVEALMQAQALSTIVGDTLVDALRIIRNADQINSALAESKKISEQSPAEQTIEMLLTAALSSFELRPREKETLQQYLEGTPPRGANAKATVARAIKKTVMLIHSVAVLQEIQRSIHL